MTVTNPQNKIDRPTLERLVKIHGYDGELIAGMFGCHPDSLWRIWRQEYGYWREPVHYRVTEQQRERIVALSREGLPSTWIAEEVGLPVSVVRYRRPADAPFDMEQWRPVWQYIRRHAALREIHDSIAPKPSHQHNVESVLDTQMRLAA